MIKMHLISFSY